MASYSVVSTPVGTAIRHWSYHIQVLTLLEKAILNVGPVAPSHGDYNPTHILTDAEAGGCHCRGNGEAGETSSLKF